MVDFGRLWGWVVSFGGGAGAVGFVVWAIRRLVDHRLDAKMAIHKSDLERQADLLRHELQREMVKVELSANRLHVVYPRLFDKLQRAHGAIAGLLGARFAESYEGYDRTDIEGTIARLRVPGELRDKVLQKFDRDRAYGIAELKALERRVEIQRAHNTFNRAKNYLIVKSLYASREVKDATLGVLEKLWKAWVEVQVGEMPGNPGGTRFDHFSASVDSAGEQLNQLEELMRSELTPR